MVRFSFEGNSTLFSCSVHNFICPFSLIVSDWDIAAIVEKL